MSYVFTLTGNTSILKQDFFPPILLDSNYSCGLVAFNTYNSIPNITSKNNVFKYGSTILTFEEGCYEIDDIIKKITEKFTSIKINANLKTLKVEINGKYTTHFDVENSIAPVLGFSKKSLKANTLHVSDQIVSISSVQNIRILCNIIENSFDQNNKAQILHELPITVENGYKITETPSQIIYLPVCVSEISQLVLSVVDQNNNLIDFRKEQILIRIHLKKND